ncbi:hypothetical protein [Alienimonas sp. DA493]|uniref:phage portal protein family protein n=1 Tax=Alienimonas sp. DA493 TaxID=3373605 RepID=UPI0037541D97
MTTATGDSLFTLLTAGYEPPPHHGPDPDAPGGEGFTFADVPRMRCDPDVKLGMRIVSAPLLAPVFSVPHATAPEAERLTLETARAVWLRAGAKIVNAIWNTLAAGEIVWRKDRNGEVTFDRLRAFHPTDARLLTRGGALWGVKVQAGEGEPVALGPGKFFAHVHGREFGAWYGRSELEGAWRPWREKTRPRGQADSRRLWYAKHAFSGGLMRHPVGTYTDQQGVEQSYEALAHRIMANMVNGAGLALPNSKDDDGQDEWTWTPAEIGGDAGGLLEYGRELNTEILRGLGIPDDVITQVSGTGSYAGRTVPLRAFMTGLQEILNDLANTVREQIVVPCLRVNLGAGADAELRAEIDLDTFLPSGTDSPPPAGSPNPPPGRPGDSQPPEPDAGGGE